MTTTKPTQSMSAFVDSLIMQGTTWDKFLARCKAEAQKRGIKDFQSLGALKRHVRHQKAHGWRIEEDESGVRGWPPTKAEKPKPMAKPKAKAPAKMTLTSRAKMGAARRTGKATGKQVTNTTENGRQTAEPVVEQTAPETKTEQAA